MGVMKKIHMAETMDDMQLDLPKFVAFTKNNMGIELSSAQITYLKQLANGWAEGRQVVHMRTRAQGESTLIKAIGKYLQDGLNV